LAVVDPACGEGAFLAAGSGRFPRATLLGLEISPQLARRCRRRVPGAAVLAGDALRGGLEPLLRKIDPGSFEWWVGNPPYNGNSPLLSDPNAYRSARALLPKSYALPSGTSLRDDYAFFLLLAAARLQSRWGALTFLTSATLLDAFLYAPIRHSLLHSLSLREVVDLGPKVFPEAQVRTCISIWTSPRRPTFAARFRRRIDPVSEAKLGPSQLSEPVPLNPSGPEWLLRPRSRKAEKLARQWSELGEPLRELVPLSFSGLKTRFQELLVDEDRERLLERLRELREIAPAALLGFANRHRIPERCLGKLGSLKNTLDSEAIQIDPRKARPFFKYAGQRHRGVVPASARAWCYLDRRLIPRGDHRLQGRFDPHACPVKLVFNVRELPLCAALLELEGCVHDHRHARFAPLFAPAGVFDRRLDKVRNGPAANRNVPNLSQAGLKLAKLIGGPLSVFKQIVSFINSPEVQEIWAPAFATTRELPVPVHRWIKESRIQM
jgi:hypothetical protein